MQNLIPPKYKSYSKIFYICLNASLATFLSVYNVVYIGLLTIKDFQIAIVHDYGFIEWGWAESSYKSIIQGIVPAGAIIGAFLSSIILHQFSRRNGILFTNLIIFIQAILLIFVSDPSIFLLMRLLQGLSGGILTAIIPLYINEILTPDLGNLGSLTQISMAFAVFFCCILAFVFPGIFNFFLSPQTTAYITWRILACIPLITILFQSYVLVFVYPYETVKYWITNEHIEEAKILAQQLYDEEYIKEILHKQKEQIELQTLSSPQLASQDRVNQIPTTKSPMKTVPMSKIAIMFSIHITLLQQMSGASAIAVYGKNTLEEALEGHSIAFNMSTLGLFALSLVAALITGKLMKNMGRKYLIQLGTAVCTVCLGVIAISFYMRGTKTFNESVPQSILIIFAMCVYMLFFGVSLGPIVWLYIPEIVEPHIIPYPVMVNSLGCMLCITLFPLFERVKYVPFLFFFVWCFVSLIVNQRIMVETKDRPRQEVYREFGELQQIYFK